MKKLQLLFDGKYKTSKRIGLGAVTEIYLASFQERELAVKLEPIGLPNTLQKEAKYYKLIKKGTGISSLYWYGVEHGYRVMVIDVLGPSLQQLLQIRGAPFSLKTVLLLTQQILERIEWVHSKGLIYNDVDPSNLLIGLGEKCDKIFLADLGSCRKYQNAEGIFLKLEAEKHPPKSATRFRSVHRHINKRTGRRDDLESIGYLLVYFLKGRLPWDQLEETVDKDLAIKERKIAIPIPHLCEELPNEFIQYFEYVNTLQFEEEPDYSWIRRLFRDLFEAKGFIDNRVMDWAVEKQ